jgi:hypothetical protein
MKQSLGRKIGIMCFGLLILSVAAVALAQTQYPNFGQKEFVIKRGFTKEALSCIECHAKKMPGIVGGWKASRMSHVGVACYDCHVLVPDYIKIFKI